MDRDIKERTFSFSLKIIDLFQQMSSTNVNIVLGKQVLRSGTSIGANVEEATAAVSKNDFAHKMNIALKEARETHYWLRLIRSAQTQKNEECTSIINEAEELKKILGAIVSKARGKSKP
jgi:four helix bundle protein